MYETALRGDSGRASADCVRYAMATDSLMDALEDRVAAIEEVLAAKGLGRLRAAWRLARMLRRSVGPFEGGSFADRRREAVSADWGSAHHRAASSVRSPASLRLAGPEHDHPDLPNPADAGPAGVLSGGDF